MKVILRQDIDTLGDKNEIKTVAAGYARNFLTPRGLAVLADAQNLKDLERRIEFEGRRQAKIEKALAASADKIRDTRIQIEARAGLEGKLYGSVSSKEIAKALSEKLKAEIDKKRIKITESIRRVGEHTVSLRLKENLSVNIIVVVVPDADSDKPEEKPAPEAAPETTAEAPVEAAVAATEAAAEENPTEE